MSDYWLISNEDVGEVVTALEDARRHASREGQRAYFDGVLHTLHSGLHTTDAIPTDFQPVVTVHADPSMTPSTGRPSSRRRTRRSRSCASSSESWA